MLNWFVVSNNEVKDQEEVHNEPSIVIPVNLLSEDLLKEIVNFNHSILITIDEPNRYFFYDLLDEIRDGVDLTHVEIESNRSTFISKMQYTLEVLIVDKRIGIFGKDNGFSYTDKEYTDAYKRLVSIEISNRYRRTSNIGFILFVSTTIGVLVNNNQFLSGMYLTNILLFGSFILNSIYA